MPPPSVPEIIIEGDAKRTSVIASGVVNERHFVLFKDSSENVLKLCSYREKTIGDEHPSKSWNVTHSTTVTEVTPGKFRLRDHQSPLGFLSALAKQKSGENVEMVRPFNCI